MITTKRVSSVVALFAAMTMGAVAFAAPEGNCWRGSRGWSTTDNYGRLFDADTVTSIGGEIVALSRFTPMKGMSAGVHIKVKTATETVDVHLGPAWYVDSLNADLKIGDRVEVKGSRVAYDTGAAIIAVTIKRGDDMLVLRDADGFPRWAGWRRARSQRN